jgi:myosin heavy subunit
MEGSAARRKEENDEMQQELLSVTATAAKQEREIQSLKMELDAKTLGQQSEIAKLEEKIAVLEKNPVELRNAQDLQMELRVKEVKDRLEKLKWRNTSLKEENLNLRERLEQAEAMAKDNTDYDRTKALEQQLSKQMAKVKLLQSELKSMKEPPVPPSETSSSREPPASAPPKSPPHTSEKSTTQTEVLPPKTDKVAAPSPSRRLMLFGRKRVPSQDGTSDDSQPKN